MSQEKSGLATATLEWREKVCASCGTCNAPLAFMEGPVCDACLDADERKPCSDIYYSVKHTERKQREAEVERALRFCEYDEDSPEVSGVRPVVRDTLAVDLSCLGKVVFHRPRASTLDTLPVGWKTQKSR